MAAEFSDAELLARHSAGDSGAFSELVRRHRDRLWAVALRTLGDPEEAADAVQDALVSAYRAAGSFRGDAAVTTWLHRVVVNACLDRARRRAARPTVPLVEEVAAAQVDPSDGIADSELRAELITALNTLPPEQRAALVLVDMQGYPVDEAARILRVPAGTVKSRCARARAKLVPLLTHLRPGRAGPEPGDAPTSRQGNQDGPPAVQVPSDKPRGSGAPPIPRAAAGDVTSANTDGGER